MSIVIRRSCWPFGFEPRFGMRFEVRGRMCTAKSCDSDEIAYTVRLTADERAEGDQ